MGKEIAREIWISHHQASLIMWEPELLNTPSLPCIFPSPDSLSDSYTTEIQIGTLVSVNNDNNNKASPPNLPCKCLPTFLPVNVNLTTLACQVKDKFTTLLEINLGKIRHYVLQRHLVKPDIATHSRKFHQILWP